MSPTELHSSKRLVLKRRSRLAELIYFVTEFADISLTSRKGPGCIMRRVYRVPVLVYRMRLWWLISDFILLLTTIGRKSGKARVTPLAYHHAPETDTYFICSGWPQSSQWYRNLEANPNARVQAGGRSFDGIAERVSEDEAIWLIADYNQRNPLSSRLWPKLTGTPFDGSEAGLHSLGARFPIFALRPANPQPR